MLLSGGQFRSNKAFATDFDALSSQPVSDTESIFSVDATIRNLINKAVNPDGVEGIDLMSRSS